MQYAQIIDNRVILIGGSEVGLPLPDWYLAKNENVLNIPVENGQASVGDYYQNGEFMTEEEYLKQFNI